MLYPKIKIQKSPDYTFAVAKIRVWESKLLSASVFYQLADSRGLSGLESILNSTAYGNLSASLWSLPATDRQAGKQGEKIALSDFDDSLDAEEITTLKELKSFLKNDKFLMPFFYKRDFHNLKLFAKSKFTKVEADWLKESLIEKETLAEAIIGQDFSFLPKTYQDFLNGVWKEYEKSGNWQILDAFLEQRLYEQILNITEEFPFANYFFKAEIDLINIKTFLRCKKRDVEADLFDGLFITGGLLDKKIFGGTGEESANKLLQRLKFTPYDILTSAEKDASGKFDEFYEMEKKCHLVLLKQLSCARYTAFGYEPILRYIFLKTNEIRNLRAVFVGKLHNISSEEIKASIGPFNA